jgi:transposase InsO family protein
MCEVLKVSKSGYYAWKNRKESRRKIREKELLIMIKEVYHASRGRYGSRRIFHSLRARGIKCYLNQITRIMAKYGIRAKTKRKFKVTTD